MKRRAILKYTAYITGAAIAAPLATFLLTGCKTEVADTSADYTLKFFSKEEFKVLKKLVDTILPKTDSPSASEVGVHQMIDRMVGEVYVAEDQLNYQKGYESLTKFIGEEEMLMMLKKLENTQEEPAKPAKDAYLHLKQQTIAFYLSTEEIAKNYLNYLPVPGEYKACISLEEAGGKVWAL